jgi:hypothetical protein
MKTKAALISRRGRGFLISKLLVDEAHHKPSHFLRIFSERTMTTLIDEVQPSPAQGRADGLVEVDPQ